MRQRSDRVFLFFVLLNGIAMTNQLTAKPPEKVAEIEGITEYRLENGFRVLLFPDSSKPTVTVNLTIFVGSRHEGYGEAGMAHLLEHMLFKGTPTHPHIDKLMQAKGANFNGTTWTDRTNYYETMPAGDENLEFGIKLEADRMINSFIRGEDLASEMTVVRNEFERGENDPGRVLSQRIQATAFEWHNYGKSTIGNRSDIERVPITKLREFYTRHYQPDNALLVVAGKFDRDKALDFTNQYFGSIPRPDREIDRTYTEEPAQDGERTVVLRRVGEVGIVGVAYHIPASAHEDFAAVSMLSYILAMEPSGRLYTSLVETKKAATVSGYAFAWHDPALMMMDAEVLKGGDLEEVRQVLLQEIERIGADGVTGEEVERARQQILKSREEESSNSTRLAVSLSNWAAQGDWRLYFLYRDRTEKVTADDVKRVAEKYCRRNNRTVGLFIPADKAERVEIPATPNIQELVGNYQGREAIAEGEQFDPSPEIIDARTTRGTVGEGISIALLPKKTRGEVVQLNLTLRYGDAENLKGLDTACQFLPTLMTRGTKKMTHQQIQDALDNNFASLHASGGLGTASFQIQTKRKNLPEVLSILRQILREPSLPEKELEVLRGEQLAELEAASKDPQELGITELRRRVSPYPKDSARYIPSMAESLELCRSVTLDEIRKIYDSYLGNENGQLAIVGDFDPDEIKGIVAETFRDWHAKETYARVPVVAFTGVKGGQHSINTPDKANAAYYAGQVIAMSDTHPDYPALVIGNYILGGGSLASRLGDRVRQKEGLSYGVFSGVHAESLDERASLTVVAISNPDNVPKVVAVIREEVDRFLKDGIDDAELKRATQGYLEHQNINRGNDGALASILNGLQYTDRTMQHYADFEAKVKSLTKEDILQAFQKHVDPDKFVVVVAGDFEPKEKN